MPVVSNPNITGAPPVNVTTVSPNNYSISLNTQTLTITGNGSTSQYSLSSTYGGTVALPLPSISINPPHGVSASLGGYNFNLNIVIPTILPASSTTNNVASVTSTATSLTYSITVPPASLTANTNTAGVTTFSLVHGPLTTTTSISAANLKAWSLSGNTVTASDYLGTNNSADLIFKTNNLERMRITSGGNIGIGTNAPAAKLHVVGTNTNNINTRIETGYLQYQPQGVISYTPGSVVMCNNTVGDLIYGNSPTPTVFTGINNGSVSSISTTAVPLNIGPSSQLSFTKQYNNSVVEIELYATITGTTVSASNLQVWFSIDADSLPITGTYSSSVFRVQTMPIGSFGYFAHVKCYYYGTSGLHNLKVMCKVDSGSITNVVLDSGGYGGLIFVKENF